MPDSLLEATILDRLGAGQDLFPVLAILAVLSCGIGALAWSLNRRGVLWTVGSFGLSLFATPLAPLLILTIAEILQRSAEADREKASHPGKSTKTSSAEQDEDVTTEERGVTREEWSSEFSASVIKPLRKPTYEELADHLATVDRKRDVIPKAAEAFEEWFETREIQLLDSDDHRAHISPQLFYFKREEGRLVGRKWAISGYPLDSAASLAQEAHAFGNAASENEHPEVFLLVFEDRGASGARRLGFQEVRRTGESDLLFCNLVEHQNSFARIGDSYSRDLSQANIALDIAKSFWLGTSVDVKIDAPDEITVGREPAEKEQQVEEESQESDLGVTFEVTTSYGESSKATEELLAQSRSAWTPPDTTVNIRGREIPGGMIYVGEELSPVDGYQSVDPALVNPSLSTSRSRTDAEGDNLNYWPSFADIPADSRAAYLDWLASGRREERYDIGYIFLFFYGLERRILFDANHDEKARKEISAIIEELEALKGVYGPRNGSFQRYCEQLISYTRRTFGHGKDLSSPKYETDRENYRMSRSERIALGRLIASGEPLPVEWALAWIRSDPEASLRTPGRRCQEEFDTLFRRRYEEWFEGGLHVEAKSSTLTVSYRPASAGIQDTHTQRIEGVADLTRITIPDKLRELAGLIEGELDDYSRWIGRRDDRTSLAALGQLPSELIQDRAGEKSRRFVQEIEDWMGEEEHAVISSETLLEHWPSKNEDYLTKTEAEALSGFLSGFGFGVEPDVRYTRNPSKRDHLTIFRMNGDGEEPSETFESARLLVHLAAAVAGADDEIAPGEEEYIERHLEEALDLNESEQARLRAHLARLLKHPPSMRGVRRRADELSDDQRRSLATFLLTVAGADGYLDGAEINILEKIYDILDLDEDQVHQDLHSLSARDPGETDPGPVTVIEGEEQETYRVPNQEESPPSEESNSNGEGGGVDLDLQRVSEVQDETQDVARVLDDVFSEEEEEAPAFAVDGLTEAHESLLVDLQEKETWSRSEFEELAESHGLIPGFAIEQINDSAFEVADEPLLEGEDPIELNSYALDAMHS